jgi:hypothetical protein
MKAREAAIMTVLLAMSILRRAMESLTQLFAGSDNGSPTAEIPIEVNGDVEPKAVARLSIEDEQHLDQYENKLQLVRDYTRGVALGYSNGFFLYGVGGISKSYSVLGELERLGVAYRLFNSRMSGRGLFDALSKYHDTIHVLEDMERVMGDKNAQGVLRSATWSQRSKEEGRQKRVVTWATGKGVESFVFSGGIIMLSNRPLDDLPELAAIRTRISHLHLVVSDSEIAALMRKLSAAGFQHDKKTMTPDECRDVCEFLIAQSKSRQCRLDMRMLDNSYRDYMQWREGSSTSDWATLVATRLEGQKQSQADTMAEREEEISVMEQAIEEHPDSVRDQQFYWSDLTGKSRASFFRCRQTYFKRLRDRSEQPTEVAIASQKSNP